MNVLYENPDMDVDLVDPVESFAGLDSMYLSSDDDSEYLCDFAPLQPDIMEAYNGFLRPDELSTIEMTYAALEPMDYQQMIPSNPFNDNYEMQDVDVQDVQGHPHLSSPSPFVSSESIPIMLESIVNETHPDLVYPEVTSRDADAAPRLSQLLNLPVATIQHLLPSLMEFHDSPQSPADCLTYWTPEANTHHPAEFTQLETQLDPATSDDDLSIHKRPVHKQIWKQVGMSNPSYSQMIDLRKSELRASQLSSRAQAQHHSADFSMQSPSKGRHRSWKFPQQFKKEQAPKRHSRGSSLIENLGRKLMPGRTEKKAL